MTTTLTMTPWSHPITTIIWIRPVTMAWIHRMTTARSHRMTTTTGAAR
jgi:hypothetical protein